MKDVSVFEKHAQTILTAIVAGLIGWVGLTVSDQAKQIAVMSEQVKYLNSQISDLQLFARQPRFTKEDFSSLIQPYAQRIENNQELLGKREVWMENVEKRLNDLERRR